MSITALTVVTAPDGAPISLAQAKAQLRITHNAEDEHIQSLVDAATAWAEDFTGRKFSDQQVTYAIEDFPKNNGAIALPGGVVTAVNEIRYTDAEGVLQTLTGPTSAVPGTDYQESLDSDECAYVTPAREGDWPSVYYDLRNAVVIDYQVGWATDIDVPANIRHAIKFKLTDLYVVRDSSVKSAENQAAEALLFPYVIQDF